MKVRELRTIEEAGLERVRGGAAAPMAAAATNPLYTPLTAEAEVMNNPLYEASGSSGSNPLFGECDELL
jgi:hypothetical protein